MYITAKYIHVFIQASFENTNSNLLISAANNFPTSTDINCDANTPITNPTINEIIPTKIVSINKKNSKEYNKLSFAYISIFNGTGA